MKKQGRRSGAGLSKEQIRDHISKLPKGKQEFFFKQLSEIANAKKVYNQFAVCSANTQQRVRPRVKAKNENEDVPAEVREQVFIKYGFEKQVRVIIRCKRKRVVDTVDGYHSKPVIDGLVRGGLLHDDSRQFIPQPAHWVIQKCSKGEEESTQIIIEEIDMEEKTSIYDVIETLMDMVYSSCYYDKFHVTHRHVKNYEQAFDVLERFGVLEQKNDDGLCVLRYDKLEELRQEEWY